MRCRCAIKLHFWQVPPRKQACCACCSLFGGTWCWQEWDLYNDVITFVHSLPRTPSQCCCSVAVLLLVVGCWLVASFVLLFVGGNNATMLWQRGDLWWSCGRRPESSEGGGGRTSRCARYLKRCMPSETFGTGPGDSLPCQFFFVTPPHHEAVTSGVKEDSAGATVLNVKPGQQTTF